MSSGVNNCTFTGLWEYSFSTVGRVAGQMIVFMIGDIFIIVSLPRIVVLAPIFLWQGGRRVVLVQFLCMPHDVVTESQQHFDSRCSLIHDTVVVCVVRNPPTSVATEHPAISPHLFRLGHCFTLSILSLIAPLCRHVAPESEAVIGVRLAPVPDFRPTCITG